MAKPNHPGGSVRPEFTKTPFGGVSAQGKPGDSELLPGQKALRKLAKGGAGTPTQEFGRLTPIGSGALNQDFMTATKPKAGF